MNFLRICQTNMRPERSERGMTALDEVGLVRAGSIDRRRGGRGFLAAACRSIHTAK
jgi:hypothetical protein